MAGRSTRSPRNAARSSHESTVAGARSRPSKRKSWPAIPISKDCAWRLRTGRQSCAFSKERLDEVRQKLYYRLRQLEETRARFRKLDDSYERKEAVQRFLDRVRLFLQLRGMEQGPKESLAEALARALEISCAELDQLHAARIDPIHKYLTDHGVFEEIEKRKAAGTWPGGEGNRCGG